MIVCNHNRNFTIMQGYLEIAFTCTDCSDRLHSGHCFRGATSSFLTQILQAENWWLQAVEVSITIDAGDSCWLHSVHCRVTRDSALGTLQLSAIVAKFAATSDYNIVRISSRKRSRSDYRPLYGSDHCNRQIFRILSCQERIMKNGKGKGEGARRTYTLNLKNSKRSHTGRVTKNKK